MEVTESQLATALEGFYVRVRATAGAMGTSSAQLADAGETAKALYAALGRMAALSGDGEPVRCTECHMPLTMHHDPGCSQPCERCEARKAADPELAAMAAIVAAMDELDNHAIELGEDVHERVIRWAMARWNVPA